MENTENGHSGFLSGRPVAVLQSVGKAFAAVTALDGFDFAVREREFVSLLGPSGCGKSTALRLIAGLAAPTSGAIEWRDGRKPERGALGFVVYDTTAMAWAS